DVDYQQIRDWPVQDGVFFQESAVRAMRKVVVLGATVAENLFPNGDAVGQQLRVRDEPDQVIGVLAPKGQTAAGGDQDDVVLPPYTPVRTRLSGRAFSPQSLASTFSPEEIRAVQEEIRAILRASHRLAPNEPDDFTVRNQSEIAAA